MTESEAKFKKADQLFEQKRYLHAIQIYKALLDDPHFKRRAIIKLTEIYDIQNQIDASVKVLYSYLERNPDDDNLRTYFAQFLIRHKKYSEAHDVLSAVSTEKQPEKNFLMGLVNCYLNDYEIAEINFLEFIKQNRRSELLPEAFLYLAECFMARGKYDEALSYTNAAIELESQNYRAYEVLALIYYNKEMFYHASENIRKAININPSNYQLLQTSAKIFFKLNEYGKALKDFELYFKKEKLDSENAAFMGILLKKLNKISEAIEYFALALRLNPTNKLAEEQRSECLTKLKNGC